MKHYLWVKKSGDFGGVLGFDAGFPAGCDPTDHKAVEKRDGLRSKRAHLHRQREILGASIDEKVGQTTQAADAHRIAAFETERATKERISGDADKAYLAHHGRRCRELREKEDQARAVHAEQAAGLNMLRAQVAELDQVAKENAKALDLAEVAANARAFANDPTFDRFVLYECPCAPEKIRCDCAHDRHVDSYYLDGEIVPKAIAEATVDGNVLDSNTDDNPHDFEPLAKLLVRLRVEVANGHEITFKPLTGAGVLKKAPLVLTVKDSEVVLPIVVPTHGLMGGVCFWTPRVRFHKLVFRGWSS